MGRTYLKRRGGDRSNFVLAAAAYNFCLRGLAQVPGALRRRSRAKAVSKSHPRRFFTTDYRDFREPTSRVAALDSLEPIRYTYQECIALRYCTGMCHENP
jgi:hypothetical protein